MEEICKGLKLDAANVEKTTIEAVRTFEHWQQTFTKVQLQIEVTCTLATNKGFRRIDIEDIKTFEHTAAVLGLNFKVVNACSFPNFAKQSFELN